MLKKKLLKKDSYCKHRNAVHTKIKIQNQHAPIDKFERYECRLGRMRRIYPLCNPSLIEECPYKEG